MLNVRTALKRYIDLNISPKYHSFDGGHKVDHAYDVIRNATLLASYYNFTDIQQEMIYTAAAYHDIGLVYDRETHHIHSHNMVLKDEKLQEFFTMPEIQIIAKACLQHRSSNKDKVTSIFSKIISDADSMDCYNLEHNIKRTIEYRRNLGMREYDEIMEDSRLHLIDKYGHEGYSKFHLTITKKLLEGKKKDFMEVMYSKDKFAKVFAKVWKNVVK